MADESGTISVGGVSFSIGVSLAEFQKNLEQAELLARDHAARIQQILGSVSTGSPGTGAGTTGMGQPAAGPPSPNSNRAPTSGPEYWAQRRAKDQAAEAQRQQQLPPIQQVQDVVITQKVRVKREVQAPETSGAYDPMGYIGSQQEREDRERQLELNARSTQLSRQVGSRLDPGVPLPPAPETTTAAATPVPSRQQPAATQPATPAPPTAVSVPEAPVTPAPRRRRRGQVEPPIVEPPVLEQAPPPPELPTTPTPRRRRRVAAEPVSEVTAAPEFEQPSATPFSSRIAPEDAASELPIPAAPAPRRRRGAQAQPETPATPEALAQPEPTVTPAPVITTSEFARGGRYGPSQASIRQLTGGTELRQITPEEVALLTGGHGGPQRTLNQGEIDELTRRPTEAAGLPTGQQVPTQAEAERTANLAGFPFTRLSNAARARAQREQQTEAERMARIEDRPYSIVRTQQQVGLLPDEKMAMQDADLEKRFGGPMRAELAARHSREQNIAEATARAEGSPFSRVSTGALVGTTMPVSKAPVGQEGSEWMARTRAALIDQGGTAYRDYISNRLEQVRTRTNTEDQQAAEATARREGAPFSRLADRRQVGRLPADAGGAGRRPPTAGAQGAQRPDNQPSLFNVLFGDTGESQARSAIRFTAGIAGVSVGINLAAGAAKLLHDLIASTADEAIKLGQAGREVGVAYGATANQFRGAGADAFSANPETRGSRTDYLQAAASAAPLAQQFQLTNTQVQQLITSEGQLARIHGVDLPQAAQVLNQVLRGNLEAGQSLDLVLTDQYGIIKNVGLTYQQLVQAVGPAAATSIVLAQSQQEIARQSQNAAQQVDETAQAMDRFAKAADNAKNVTATAAKPAVTAAINVATYLLGPTPKVSIGGGPNTATSLPAPVQQERTDIISPPPTSPDVVARMTTTQPLSRGVNPRDSSPPALPAGYTQQVADDARLEEQARRAIPSAISQLPDMNEAQAQQRTNQQAIEQQRQTEAAARDRAAAAIMDQQRIARIQSTQAQSTVDILNIQARNRQLDQSDKLNSLALTRINIENQLAPLLLRQQAIQDRITLATRENLNLTQARLEAQRTQAITGSAVETNTYQQQSALLRAQSSIASIVQGQAPKYDIGAQIGQIRTAAFAAPDIKLADTEAQHTLNLASVAQQVDQISKAISVIPLEEEKQILEAEVMARQEELAAAQASTEVINRMLEVATIMASPERIQAERDLNSSMIAAAKAAGDLATLQLQANTASTNPVIVNVNIGSIGAAGVTPDSAAWIDMITNATRGGALDAINSKANMVLPRPSRDTPGARY